MTGEIGAVRHVEHPLDEALAFPICGMSLAGKDDLDRPLRVGEDRPNAMRIAEEEPCSLVGGETPGEDQCQPFRVELLVEPAQPRRALSVTGELLAQPATESPQHAGLLGLVSPPQLRRRHIP